MILAKGCSNEDRPDGEGNNSHNLQGSVRRVQLSVFAEIGLILGVKHDRQITYFDTIGYRFEDASVCPLGNLSSKTSATYIIYHSCRETSYSIGADQFETPLCTSVCKVTRGNRKKIVKARGLVIAEVLITGYWNVSFALCHVFHFSNNIWTGI